ncbi:MAG TPA: hypothetical protein VJP40_08440, partial [bacterium]|nr:hypothetical protein [bacterium]
MSTDLFHSLSPNQKSEIESLKQERDALLFGDALLNFASRREHEGHSELAVPLYQRLSEFSEVPAEIRSLAHRRSEALQGRGPIGAQAEVLVSRFSKEALNPAPILAMGIAGSVFKVSRALSLNFLRQAPVDRILARATANGIGLLSESAAFTVTAKSVASGLGQAQDWSLPALKREWLAGTILLGSIKAGGALGVRSGRDLVAAATRSESLALQRGLTLASSAAQPLGLYGGILLSHQIETGLGLRPAQSAANGLIDGAATLFHLYVGGRIAQGLGADRLNRAATQLEHRIENLPGPGAGSVFSRFFRPAPAIAMAAKAGESLAWQPMDASRPFRAQAYDSTGSSPVMDFIQEARFVENFTRRLPGSTSDQLRTLISNYQPLSQGSLKHRFLLMLGRASVSQETNLLEAAIPTLSEALKFAEIGSPSSSYSHWLTKHIFERSLHHNEIATLDGLLRFLGEGGKVSDFEAQVAEIYPRLELPKGPPPTPRFWIGRERVYGSIRNLNISSESKIILSKWVGALSSPSRSPLSISDLTLVDRLLYQQGLENIPNRMDQLDRIIRLAGDSPLGLARFTRLQNLLEHSTDVLLNFKLEELADPSSTIRGRSNPWSAPESGWPAQSNAYLGDRAPLKLLAEMRTRRADLLDPESIESRQAHRNAVLKSLFPNGVAFESLKTEVL